jgi:hypothetical protein
MIEPTPARHETVILWHGDDYQPLADLVAAVETAAKMAVADGPARLGDDSGIREATAAYDAFREEALTRATQVELQALPRGGRNSDGSQRVTWRGLLAEHPPRKVFEPAEQGDPREVDHPEDLIGWNTETMPDPLVRASLVPGQFESDEKRDQWLDGLSDPEFSRLYSAAVGLNMSGGPDPKARLSLLLDRTSTETSKSPERLG